MPRTEVFDRMDVLEKAKQVFWHKGYNGTSMQDLVDATGLNRSSIYNSFGSKMEMYQDVLKHYMKYGDEIFGAAAEKAEGPLNTIRLIFGELLSSILRDTEGNGCLAINCTTEMASHDAKLAGLVTHNREQVVQIFKELVEKGQEAGEINTQRKSSDLAQFLVTAFLGLRISGATLKDKKVLQRIVDNTLHAIE